MTFTIVGTGNMALFIGNRLVAARHQCKGVFGRTPAGVKKLAEALLCNNFGDIAAAKDVEADVCFLAVADSAVADVAAMLSYKKTVVVHTAGAISLEAISTSSPDTAVLWPIYSIASGSLPTHRNIPCAWEASTPKAEKYLLSLAHVITDVLFEAKHDQRKWLHVSAVFSNNFVNHMMAISKRICAEHNLPFSVLEPIIDLTFNRLKQNSPTAVQTGPAKRRDKATIAEQTTLLADHPDWQKVYEAITLSIQAVD